MQTLSPPNLAIVKAVVEGKDEDTYFSSFTTLGIWVANTKQLGLVHQVHDVLEATDLGRLVYFACQLDQYSGNVVDWCNDELLNIANEIVFGVTPTLC